ncbi:MAG: hypothetical protein JJE17_10180 [Peptostreptococcaceae bacterium]|nr:hypothetical protein [Peptostreptococcaceae bacterium]
MIVAEKTYYKELVEKFEKELLLLPIGCISKKRIKGKDYFYHQTCKTIQGRPKKSNKELPDAVKKKQITSKYLKKDDLDIMTGIKRKRFIEKSMPKLRKDFKILEQLSEKYYPYDPAEIINSLSEIYTDIPIREFLREESGANEEWLGLREVSNDFYAENLRHTTSNGRAVRSKSEAIIADLLDSHNISYKYEVEICVENKKYSPDFAVLRKSDNKIIYWEHFGLIGNEEYASAMLAKINDYYSDGIMLWDNLIMTSDSSEGSIDAMRINNMIKAVLLT